MFYKKNMIQSNNVKHNNIFLPYNESEISALIAGFQEVADERAYRGRYFIKNNLKWIHNIESLRHKLNMEYGRYICDEELSALGDEGFGYDVETYYQYNCKTSLNKIIGFNELMNNIRIH